MVFETLHVVFTLDPPQGAWVNPNRDANVATPFSQLLNRPKFVYRGQVPDRVCGKHLG